VSGAVRVRVNGAERELGEGGTVADVVAAVTEQTRGVAVAVNGEVVPRSRWAQAALSAGDRVEVLTAAQGG
jgi:sulfur carrier protein